MSREDFKGSAWAFQQLMEGVRDEIAAGERKGVTVKFATPHPKVRIQRWIGRTWRQFQKHA